MKTTQQMAAVLDQIFPDIKNIQEAARRDGFRQRPRWPMVVLRTPKGWTGPKVVDGKQIEGTFREDLPEIRNWRGQTK